MRKKFPFNGGMSAVMNAVTMPDNTCELIENMYLDNDGVWKAFLAPVEGLDIFNSTSPALTASKIYQWTPAYLPASTIDDTFIYIVFYTNGTVKYVHKTAVNTYTKVDLGLTGLIAGSVYAWADSNQFVFVDGRDNHPAQRIRINSDGVVSIGNLSPASTYLFPTLVKLNFSEEDNEGTGIGKGGIYGYRAVFVNEFGEYSKTTPLLMIDTYQWQARGMIDGEGNYIYDDTLRGSLKSAVIGIPEIPANTVEVQLFRCDAYGSECKQPMSIMRRVASKIVSKTTTSCQITDAYPYGLIELNVEGSRSPAGDDIALLNGVPFIGDAVNTIDFPVDLVETGSIVHRITLTNPNEYNYVNRWFMIDLFDKRVNHGGTGFLDDFLWSAGVITDVDEGTWTTSGTRFEHVAGNVTPLSVLSPVPAIGNKYLLTYTISIPAGSITSLKFGGESIIATAGTHTLIPVTATDTTGLVLTPSSDYNGTIGDIAIIEDGDVVWYADKSRIMADDFITPLDVYLYPLNASIDNGTETAKATRRYAFIRVPYVSASSDTIIYFVQSIDDFPTDYPKPFNELTDAATIQAFYSSMTANPVKGEESIVCVSNKTSANPTWLPSNYDLVNKANKNYERDGFAPNVSLEYIRMFDELAYLTDITNACEGTYHETNGTGTTTCTYSNSSIFMKRKGYCAIWAYLSMDDLASSTVHDILKLQEDDNDPKLELYVYHDGGGTYDIKLLCEANALSGSFEITNNHTFVSKFGRVFILFSWELTPNASDLDTSELKASLYTICLDDYVIKNNNSSDTGFYIDETGTFGCKLYFKPGLRSSHPVLQFGDYIDASDTSLKHNLRQLCRWFPYFPIGFIGIDYSTTAITNWGTFYNNSNVSIEKISNISEKNPGRLWCPTDERNLSEEILRIVPYQSLQPVDEHNVMILWTSKDYWFVQLLNDGTMGKPVKYGEGLGLMSRPYLTTCYRGVAWNNEKGIYYLTSKGVTPIGIGYIDSSSPYYLFNDQKNKRIWAAYGLTQTYFYDILTKTWARFNHASIIAYDFFYHDTTYYMLDKTTKKLYSFPVTNPQTYMTTLIKTKAYNIGRRGKIKRMTLLGNLFTGTFTYLCKLFGALTYGTQATLSTNLIGDNNDLTYTSIEKGQVGTKYNIYIEYVNAGGTEDLACDVTYTTPALPTLPYYVISITLKTVASVIQSSANEVRAIIDATPDANRLVTVANKTGNNGGGQVTAMARTILAVGNPTGTAGTSATYTAQHNKPHSPVNVKSDYVQFQITGSNQVSGIEIEVK